MTALYAAAAALGITTAGMSFIELAKKINQKGGNKYSIDWEKLTGSYISEYSKIAAAEKATEKLDSGERDRLNDMANANAEKSNVLAPHFAEKATEKLDRGERDRLNDMANANADRMQTLNAPLYTPPGQENYDEDVSVSIPTIEDKTQENVEQEVPLSSTEDWLKVIQDAQKAQWEREDEKQRHLEEREDSAYQRAVADMRKAGINPNLMNVTPSESGMVTSSTGMDFSAVTTQMSNEMKELLDSIDKNFSGNENEKDRIKEFITSLGQIAVMFAAISGKSKKGG